MKKVSVVGLGYIGLPTAIVLAESGFEVFGYDIDKQKIEKIKQGVAVIEEHELGDRLVALLNRNIDLDTSTGLSMKAAFSTCPLILSLSKNAHPDTSAGLSMKAALSNRSAHPELVEGYERFVFNVSTNLEEANYFIIAVPTPIKEDKKSDLSYVWAAVQEVSKKIKKGDCVIIESTVPVGTTNKIAEFIADKTSFKLGVDFYVAFSPERVMPGKIFFELVNNDRLVGGVDKKSSLIAKKLYEKFVKAEITITDAKTAEMVKLVENSSRDVQIAFANQVSSMANSANINAKEVIALANKHPRVNILNPGPGVGGHCIAVDPWFLIESFPGQTKLLQSARHVNDFRPQEVLGSVRHKIDGIKKFKKGSEIKVCILGVTYKPDIDDLRNSPSLKIAKSIDSWSDTEVSIIDPHADINFLKNDFKNVFKKNDECLQSSDLVIALVAHTEFKKTFQASFAVKDVISFCELEIGSSFYNTMKVLPLNEFSL